MRPTKAALSIGLIVLLTLVAGCGGSDEVKTPAACLSGPAAYEKALGGAPRQAHLDGDVRISDCLVKNQPDGALVGVGQSLVTVATNLSRQVKKDAAARAFVDPPASLEAGYLVGAVEKGAEKTDGIHATLVQRVKAAATNNIANPAQKAQYAIGYKAGKSDG